MRQSSMFLLICFLTGNFYASYIEKEKQILEKLEKIFGSGDWSYKKSLFQRYTKEKNENTLTSKQLAEERKIEKIHQRQHRKITAQEELILIDRLFYARVFMK